MTNVLLKLKILLDSCKFGKEHQKFRNSEFRSCTLQLKTFQNRYFAPKLYRLFSKRPKTIFVLCKNQLPLWHSLFLRRTKMVLGRFENNQHNSSTKSGDIFNLMSKNRLKHGPDISVALLTLDKNIKKSSNILYLILLDKSD
jgi:hypothetical protein